MIYLKYATLFLLMCFRNIRWVFILLFMGKERSWRILDFRMNLCARQAGLDPKENSIHKQLILDHTREFEATELMRQYIQPDDVILELGANIGYYVLLESQILSENGCIYAVEPSAENVALLKRNVELNQVRHIDIDHMAMSDTKGTAKLYTGDACNLHSLVNESGDSTANFVEVPTDTVDGYLAGKKPITFLRMDIEGYEAVIIDGMQETLASPVLKRMFIEIHPAKIESDRMQVFLKTLEEHGFEIDAAISRDNWQRSVLGQCKVEHMTLADLAKDPRVVQKRNAFEIFFKRV